MTTFDSTQISLMDLLAEIQAGQVQLPDFQRSWIWNDDQIRDLLGSLCQGFPIGTFTLLRYGAKTRLKHRVLEGLPRSLSRAVEPELLILDGQQRLTSLLQTMMFDKPVQTRLASRRSIKRHYYLDMQLAVRDSGDLAECVFSVDETRKQPAIPGGQSRRDLSTTEAECRARCFPCNRLISPEAWEATFARECPGDSTLMAEFRSRILERFARTSLPLSVVGEDTPKRDVCRIFENVNKNTSSLSVFELLTAKFALADYSLRDDWYGSLPREIPSRRDNITRNPLLEDIDATHFIQAISLLHTHDLRLAGESSGKPEEKLRAVSARSVDILDLPLDAWKTWAARLETAYEEVAYFLRAEALYHPRELPYKSQLIPLAAVMARIGDRWREPQIRDKLARWYWCGVLGELYDGDVEARMACDYSELLDWFRSNMRLPRTIREASFTPERFEFLHTRNSAAYKGVALLILREGAEDWFWRATVRDLKIYEILIDIQQIFPRQWCEKQGYPRSRYDSILNKSPLSYKVKRRIGHCAPSEYLEKIQTDKQIERTDETMDAVLSTHALSPELLRSDDFNAFIDDRRERLSLLVADAMGKSV